MSGGLDAAALRRSWDAVLDTVKGMRRSTQVLLMNAQVLTAGGGKLTLGFETPGLMRQFSTGGHADVLQDALRDALGATFTVEAVVGRGDTHEPRPAARPPAGSAPAPPPPPAYEGFAPGDEAEPEDPDAPAGPPVERVSGDEAALRLVQQELGGRVLGTLGDD